MGAWRAREVEYFRTSKLMSPDWSLPLWHCWQFFSRNGRTVALNEGIGTAGWGVCASSVRARKGYVMVTICFMNGGLVAGYHLGRR